MTLDPNDLDELVRNHFSQVTREQFVERSRRAASDEIPADIKEYVERAHRAGQEREHGLRQAMEARPLQAYFASALTGLTPERREKLKVVAAIAQAVCDEHDIGLHKPGDSPTDPVANPNLAAAHVFVMNHRLVLTSDLLIVHADSPSFGAGQELEFARAALIPIIVIVTRSITISRMVTGIPSVIHHVTCGSEQRLRARLRESLQAVQPIALARRQALRPWLSSNVGERIRLLREQRGLTHEAITRLYPFLTVETLRQIEEEPDVVANPSLIQLQQIAVALGTSIADLVPPQANGPA